MRWIVLAVASVVGTMTASAEPVRLYAAGSLKAVMADIVRERVSPALAES